MPAPRRRLPAHPRPVWRLNDCKGGRLAPAEAEALKIQAEQKDLTMFGKGVDQAEALKKKAETLGIERDFAPLRDTHDLER
jgi:hypothetical protein